MIYLFLQQQQEDITAGFAVLIMMAVFGLVGAILYFLPSIIAGSRRHHNLAAIVLLNAFLGWTFIGWVAALVWSATQVNKR
jgi:cytochrome c biogenesis protein CcdA